MRFSGSADFTAGRAEVWGFLIDPTRLGDCVPMPISRVDETHFRSETTVGSGLFSAVFRVDVELVIGELEGLARFVAHGGGSGTTIDGTTSFALSDGATAGTTHVDWATEFTLGGMFAGPGERLIQEHAPEAISSLEACLHRQIDG